MYRAGLVLLTPEITIGPDPLPDGSSIGSVAAIAGGPQGGFYVVDIRGNDIKEFDAFGRFIRVIGGRGPEPGRFNTPSDMAFSGDKLLVNDLGNRRLDVLGLDGSPIADLPWTGPLEHPVKLRGLPDGRVIMESEKLDFGDPTGPQDVTIRLLGPGFGPDLDIHRARVRRNTYVRPPSGGLANVPQPFHPELFWDVSTQGTVVIGSSESYGLDIYDPDKGKVATMTRDWDPIEVTADDREQWFASLVQVGDQGVEMGVPDFIARATMFPALKPAFDEVMFDAEGNILVHPITGDDRNIVYDAFSPEGLYIARVVFAGVPRYFPAIPKLAVDDGFWGYEAEEDGTIRVTKWRLGG